MDILDIILAKYPTLSPAQKRVADYIINNFERAVFMSVQELSASADVSDATVVRFAKELGFSGLLELKNELHKLLLWKLGQTGLAKHSSDQEFGPSLIDKVFTLDKELISITQRQNDWSKYEELIRKIVSARRNFVVAHSYSYPFALVLGLNLNLVLNNTMTLSMGLADVFDHFRDVGSEDVLVGISVARYYRQTIEIMDEARRQGMFVAAITDQLTSPAAAIADLTLLVTRHATGFAPSSVALLSIINTILAGVSLIAGDRVVEMIQKHEELARRHYFYKR